MRALEAVDGGMACTEAQDLGHIRVLGCLHGPQVGGTVAAPAAPEAAAAPHYQPELTCAGVRVMLPHVELEQVRGGWRRGGEQGGCCEAVEKGGERMGGASLGVWGVGRGGGSVVRVRVRV